VKLVTILLEMTEIIQGMGNFGSFVWFINFPWFEILLEMCF
jgi:hypothetical protein